jgi:hypothetical protein
MGIHDNEAIFLTQEEQELFLLNQTKVSEETEDAGQQAFENDYFGGAPSIQSAK